jgi:lipoprotein releasing system LolC/E family transmembrane protein
VLYLLDEFAALGNLAPVERAMGLMAGYGVQLWPILQDVHQLRATYGRRAGTFLSNAGVLQVFGVNDQDSARLVSDLTGQETVVFQTMSRALDSEKSGISYGEQHVARPLMTPDEVRNMPQTAQMLFIAGHRPIIAGNIRAGSLAGFEGEDAIVIGTVLARRLDVGMGDRITLVSPEGRTTVFGTVPRLRPYTVAAIFEVGMQDYDGSFVYLPLPAAQVFFQRRGLASQIEVHLRDPAAAPAAADAIRRALAGHPVTVLDWQRANSGFFQIVQVQRNVMFLILTLIILVAAFNIISSLIMLVKDKGRDIAILRTMGAGRGAVLRIFLLCGAAVGGLGTLAGLGLGLLFCANIETIRQALMAATGTTIFDPEIYFLTQIPAVVDWWEVAQVTGLGFLLSLLATLFPSWRAARLDPVEALRHE